MRSGDGTLTDESRVADGLGPLVQLGVGDRVSSNGIYVIKIVPLTHSLGLKHYEVCYSKNYDTTTWKAKTVPGHSVNTDLERRVQEAEEDGAGPNSTSATTWSPTIAD